MNTSAITSKKINTLAPNTLSIFHQPQFSPASTNCGAACLPDTVPNVGLIDEVSLLFQGYYQAFVGYPSDNYQLSTNPPVRYTLRRHSGTRFWDSPSFKAGVVGLGSVVTALSVGFLLSDSFTTPLAADPLVYNLSPETVSGGDSESIMSEPMNGNASVVDESPSMVNPIEFSRPDSK